MPGKIKVKVLAGRNLPVMDRASDTTDAFVEIKFGGVTHKTDVCRKSLNPHWNSTEWYRFEVDESELQDEPLQLRLMDHDTYSANDAIGKVVISLAPLLAREANNANGTTGPPGGAVMSGWIPVFDTMHGTRGELNIIVKVELFSDFNKYKTSSCGVQFFHCPMIPPGYRATAIHGFVEELIVNDDPEYQWIDKIRTPRASNEARQVAFIKLSNQVQRLVGVKAAELGANAVVGYQQDFDLEGEAGVVARAIGTAVNITALPIPNLHTNIPCTQQQLKKYLDILATDEDSITDLSQYYQSHQEELLRIVSILNPKTCNLLDGPDVDDDEKSVDLNLQKQSGQRSYTGELSLYNEYYARKSLKNLSEDQLNINKLLNRVNSTDSSGPLQTIKKLKDNLFSKKFIKKSRKHENDDQVSIKSSSSDTSRISFNDLKKEIKKIKKLKIPKLVKNDNLADEGVGMASILVRSVFHAHTSLARISESIDSEHSPCSTLRRTSESEPNVNTAEHDKKSDANIVLESQVKEIPEIHCSSLENIKSIENVEPERKISESCPTTPIVIRTENFLKLPDEDGYYGSISSALSAESSDIYSSSEEDDESYSYKNDQEQAIETTSSLVKSVLSSDVDPQFIAQMEKKLTVLELTNSELSNNATNFVKTVTEAEVKPTCEISKLVEQSKDVSDNLNAKENVASISTPRSDTTSERERDRYADRCEREKGSPRHARHESYGGKDPASSVPAQNASLNSSSTPMGIHRRSSDSDLSVTPKGSSLNASAGNTVTGGAILRPSMNSNNLDMLEYPFLTMTEYPPGFIVHIGGTVCARSVKLVDGGGESASRAAWWAELRTELRAHARALRCTAVLAYSERAAVREDVCVLSVSGTAAVINLDCDFTLDETAACPRDEEPECRSAHVPYAPGAGPYRAELALCGSCRRARVPSVMLATCAKPSRLTAYAKAITLTAVAARGRRSVGSEAGARDLSDQLPFLEYELHKLLLAKLRMQGANALFSLQTQIAIGERCVMALASGTAVRLTALPAPTSPRIKTSEHDKNALEIQKALWDTFNTNKAANGYDVCLPGPEPSAGSLEGEEDRVPALELSADKDTCVLELDEAEDVETAKALAIRRSHMPVYTSALRTLSGAPPHAFMQVWRARLCGAAAGERLAAGSLAGAAYKLRRLAPAALAPSVFHLDLPEDEIQLMVLGTAIPLVDPSKAEHTNGTEKQYADTEDDIFELDEEQLVKHDPGEDKHTPTPSGQVSLTTLSSVQGSKVSRRICSLRLLFVRETTAVRELGGLSGFLHSFTSEVLAIVRAYTAALGGNALTSLYLAHLLLHHHAHKNQGQCLLSVGGDVVHITY
ncbi:C2 domain-containing protein 5 isoform X3 [Danaus plexippus]|uniref:C2 domain-containing protein 5 isoform X3 n=1 Tax=Danaus plexippus TaxID=13037 RepID=UPI002AB15208|nr:C2 domain-containing protein 5 isoform X3 [Danaus plexippus]